LVAVLVVAAWLRMEEERGGVRIANAIVAGERPVAPAVPTAALDGVDVPELPACYRAQDGRQVPHEGGRILVVNWWASWCGPCEEEAPVLNRIADRYEGRAL